MWIQFNRDLLRFKLIEDFRYENKPVYARLRSPGGDGTIALYQVGPEDSRAMVRVCITGRSTSNSVPVHFAFEFLAPLDDYPR